MQACDHCHRRKSRCDKVRPTCGYCQKSSLDCIYTDRSREPTFRKEHVESIERRLRHAEAKNKALANELAKAKSNVVPSVRGDTGTPLGSVQTSSTLGDSGDGDVINEVSFLASTAAGERHYLGSTSGVLFANLVRASVDVSNTSHHGPSSMQSANPSRVQSKAVTTANNKETLPSKELATELVANYFAHDHLCYPFLHPSSTLTIVESIYREPSYYGTHAFQAFVFDMILAIATVNVYKFDWQMLPSAETHHARAMLRITEVFQVGGIQSLQAILLLCQYRTGSSMQDTSASMWHLVGIAVRMAYELGLHRESAYAVRGEGSQDHAEALQCQEIRRRCFWSVFTLDRVVGITLGRPLAINMDDIDVKLPSTEGDYITNSELNSEPDCVVNRTSIFVHVIQYRILCGKIMRTLHGLKRPGDEDANIRDRRDNLLSELDGWRLKTRDLGLPDVDLSSAMAQDRSSFRSKEWYEMLYNNAILMLFRPSPMLSDISGDAATLQKLFQSSKQAVILYAYLHRSRKINYSWITLHSVFMAGLTYLYALSRHFRERRRSNSSAVMLASDPSPIEIVNDTRACSNVLVAVSERWNALRHCHEVFDRLSDAVLGDAIKLQCSPPQSSRQTPAPRHILEATQPIGLSPAAIQQDQNFTNGNHAYSTNGNNMSYSSWPRTDDMMAATPGFYSTVSPLAIDSEFRSCFGDLQHMYNEPYADDPVIQLSQYWLGYIEGFDGMMPPMSRNVDPM